MNKYISFIFIILFNLFPFLCYSQQSAEVRLIVNDKFDIRNISKEYFGDADLWPFILKYNSIKNLNELKSGSRLSIPVKKINDMIGRINFADKSFQDAVKMGAKVLADDLLDEAGSLLKQAAENKRNIDIDASIKAADESIKFSERAYKKTKEIREKTIDAIISFKKGTLQKMYPNDINWQNAEIYENLKENDWARTLTLSLANITFQDLSQIKLNENSQAMIQRSRYDPIENKTDTKVKIERGDAYAMLLSSPKKNFDLDIKGVKTVINSKYFWVEKNSKNAKVANYNGEIKLAVKDSAVVVKKNQGSVIPDGGYPTKPKNLPAAPFLISPDNLGNISTAKIYFAWSKINTAENYWLVIANDSRFKKLYGVYKNIKAEGIQLAGFLPGVYYWYVCSVDSAGLPGPYSEPRGFVFISDKNKPFLSIESMPENLVVRETKLIISGKTDHGCKVFINKVDCKPGTDGGFTAEQILLEGKNKIIVKAINNAGLETIIERNVYLESDSHVIVNETSFGILNENNKYNVRGNSVNLNLTTRPLTSIEIRLEKTNFSKTIYCDTLGKCSITIPVTEMKEIISLCVKTPAGFEKTILLEILKENKMADIILYPPLESQTNKETIIISGTANGASELFINGLRQSVDLEGKFSSSHSLKSFENVFIIKAIDKNGRASEIERRIIYDNIPPDLISADIQWADNSKTSVRIVVCAEDNTYLRKTAVVELICNAVLKNEILEYNNVKNAYECIISVKKNNMPRIKSVTLEDYLGNKKSYSIEE